MAKAGEVMHLSIDGGGSKCSAICFDNQLRLIGKGLVGGINVTQTPVETCRANIAGCLDQVFASGIPDKIDTVYAILVGPFDILLDELAKRTEISDTVRFSEPMGCLLSGCLRREGLLALSGTGSDVFYLSAETHCAVGGWGPILGDQGSGTWIGQRALEAFVKASDGWGPPTLLTGLIRKTWQLGNDHELIGRIHQAASPFGAVASAARLAGKAASAGDRVALGIVWEAGRLLANQMICLFGKPQIPKESRDITLNGGAWKTHPAMLAGFIATVHAYRSDLTVSLPWFEPVLAGAAAFLLDRGMSRNDARTLMMQQFPDYVYMKPEDEREWMQSALTLIP